ncbi:AraC family transcriptional regulator [Paenibacillus amylolyticus]|nr:AraC family transcriptional regulator [Paenibacillus amylolyticus]
MDWLERMNRAVSYIEDNLEQDIDYDQIAKIALCSVYQFQRMFSFVLDVPLSEYIRRRRLTLAAFDLKNRKNTVTDIALKYRYETPESFSRAFQNLHGMTPTLARNAGSELKAFPRISFQIILKGVVGMNYRIEKGMLFKFMGWKISTVTTLLRMRRGYRSPRFGKPSAIMVSWTDYPSR